jgi:TolA-binding protein
LKIDLRKNLSVHLFIKSITLEASRKVNITDDKIKALENKLETLKDISELSRQQFEELADLENQIHSHYENKTDAARLIGTRRGNNQLNISLI